MRILLICAAFPPNGKGGGPVSSELIAIGLGALGHVVRVVTVADREDTIIKDGFEIRTIPSLNVHWSYWRHNPFWRKALWHLLENFNPRALHTIRREIRDFRPNVVMTISIENINVASWYAASLEGVPCIHMIHSYFLRCWRGGMFRRGNNCIKTCRLCYLSSVGKKYFSRFVDGVTAETRFPLMAHLDKGYFPNAISRVIPGPIALPDQQYIRDRNGGALRVGYIGLHSPGKGISTLAVAARTLSGELGAEIEFIIAGDGPAEYTRKLIKEFPPTARFVGWVQPADFFPNIDVAVVPSLWNEPFGRVSAEALSYGVPAIVARSGGLPDNIIEGECGFCFDPGDSMQLADILRRLVKNRLEVREMAESALRHAQRFSVENVARDIARFMAEVCKKQRLNTAADTQAPS